VDFERPQPTKSPRHVRSVTTIPGRERAPRTVSRMTENPITDALVLITGAARGMGELYARRAVAARARAVALWDIDEDAATALAADLSRSGVDVRAYRVDVSRHDEIVSGLQRVRADLGAPDVV